VDSYLFYDLETTGLNRAFDQVLQFSAIRTDRRFEEMERHSCRVRLRPDIVPSPRALLTNRISIREAGRGMCEFEATAYIHRLFNTPGTTSLGFNSLGFDDEFLRFAFYRNLLPPYTHQYDNGCRRMDLLPITLVFWLYKRDALNWPEIEGRLSLRLEHLNDANALADGPSHDATADVEATVALARRLARETEMWEYLEGCFEKRTDSERALNLPVYLAGPTGEHRLGLMIAPEYGLDQNFQVPILSIGTSVPYGNQSLWLRLDSADLQQATPETIEETTWAVRKKFGEPGLLLPPLKRFRRGVSMERWRQVEENRRFLEARPDLFQRIIDHHRQYRYPEVPELDLDGALYEIGFPSQSDRELSRRFHAGDPARRVDLIERFKSPHLRNMAVRLLGRNFPRQLPRRHRREFEAYLARVNPTEKRQALLDYRGNARTTPVEVLQEIDELKRSPDLSARGQDLLDQLESYVRHTFLGDASSPLPTS
jgi:exodeoxyribonuclease-1